MGRPLTPLERVAAARLSGTAERYARGNRGQAYDEPKAVAELKAISTDPDVLAEAAAAYSRHDGANYWFADRALHLLVLAGADPDQARQVWSQRHRGRYDPPTQQ